MAASIFFVGIFVDGWRPTKLTLRCCPNLGNDILGSPCLIPAGNPLNRRGQRPRTGVSTFLMRVPAWYQPVAVRGSSEPLRAV
jgi:hypothetical protein